MRRVILILLLILSMTIISCTRDHIPPTPKTFPLFEPVEEDLRYPANTIQIPGEFAPLRTPYSLDFRHNRNEYAYLVAQMPHGRAQDTDLYPHFHWQTSNNNLGSVVWAVDYTCASISQDFPAFQTIKVVANSTGNSNTHLMSPEMTIPATELGISAMCKIRIFRDTEDIRDTYIGEAKLLEFDIHYYAENLGSNRP